MPLIRISDKAFANLKTFLCNEDHSATINELTWHYENAYRTKVISKVASSLISAKIDDINKADSFSSSNL